MADAQRKRELIAELERARSRFTAHQRAVGEDLHVGDKVRDGLKESVSEHRGIWLGAAALAGLVISKLPPRTKTVRIGPSGKARAVKEAETVGKMGLFIAALKWVFDLARPLLVTWGKRRLTQALGGSPRDYRRA